MEVLGQVRDFIDRDHLNLIGGEWTAGGSGDRLEVENPASGEGRTEIPASNVRDIDRAVGAVDAAHEVRDAIDVHQVVRDAVDRRPVGVHAGDRFSEPVRVPGDEHEL